MPKLNLKKLTYSQKESDWQNSVMLVLSIVTVCFVIMLAYILLRPLGSDLKTQLEEQVNSDPVKIDTNTLETLKNKTYLK